MMRIEFGTGMKPTPGYVHHDRFIHSSHIDVGFDLTTLPWPIEDNSVEEILATDVFEHLAFPQLPITQWVQTWLDECWRVLVSGGLLNMRLPSHENPYTWRDPTHYRAFHPESFHYWCPNAPGNVWKMFGKYYFGEDYSKWWKLISVQTEHRDLRFKLCKM